MKPAKYKKRKSRTLARKIKRGEFDFHQSRLTRITSNYPTVLADPHTTKKTDTTKRKGDYEHGNF